MNINKKDNKELKKILGIFFIFLILMILILVNILGISYFQNIKLKKYISKLEKEIKFLKNKKIEKEKELEALKNKFYMEYLLRTNLFYGKKGEKIDIK